MYYHLSYNNQVRSGIKEVKSYSRRIVFLIIIMSVFSIYSDIAAQALVTGQSSPSGPLDVTLTGKIINQKSAWFGSKVDLQTAQNIYRNINVNADGTFTTNLPENLPLSYRLFSDKDVLNGVNVGDIIRIQNHILGKDPITDPLSLLAADVNKSGKVTVSDIIEIRRLILGKMEQFSSGDSWIFIDADFPLFSNNWELANTWVAPTQDNGLYNEFQAVKLGDVARLIFNRSDEITVRNQGQKEVFFLTKEKDKIMLWLSNHDESMEGFQLSLDLDPVLRVYSVNPMLEDNQYAFSPDGNNLRIILTADEIRMMDDKPLFVFDESGVNSVKVPLRLSENFVNMVVTNGESNPIAPIAFRENALFESYASPNPFRENVVIRFDSNIIQNVRLVVYDINGRIIDERELNALPGQNSFSLTGTELCTAGIYFYSILGKNIQSSGKIMMLD